MTTETMETTEVTETSTEAPETTEVTETTESQEPENRLTADETTETESSETDSPESDEGKPKDDAESRAQKRIRKLAAENRALREYSEYWRGRAEPKATEKPAEKPKEAPKLSEFKGDTEKWAAAYAEHLEKSVEDRVSKTVESRIERVQQSSTEKKVESQWQERLKKLTESNPDAIEAIRSPEFVQSETMARVIKASEKGPELALHLAQNLDENERIMQMSPEMQAAALGRLESKISTPEPKQKKPSTAPNPPNPIKGAKKSALDLENCSMEEYLNHRLGRKK